MNRRRSLLFALVALAVASAAQAQPAARQKVAGVARVIEANYFDPAKATRIAKALRVEAARGAYDKLDDADLASALTERLDDEDRHFHVSVAPPGPQAQTPPAETAGPRVEDPRERRSGYGFRSVGLLPGNIGYIDLRGFADFDPEAADAPARLAADAALRLIAASDAVIVDLRDNGGGSPAMVGYLASAFAAPGADIYNTFHGRGATESEAPARPYAQPRTTTPLFVLISGRTGSAAESFAYTLQTAGRAVVVGEASAGAANPGGDIPTREGLVVFVSTGSPVNPITRSNWETTGVTPDVAAPARDALGAARRLALQAALKTGLSDENATGARWALEALTPASPAPSAATLAGLAGGYSGATVAVDGGGLVYSRGRRPPLVLDALGADLFTVHDDPSVRIVFERDAAGRAVALEVRRADGSVSRYRRES